MSFLQRRIITGIDAIKKPTGATMGNTAEMPSRTGSKVSALMMFDQSIVKDDASATRPVKRLNISIFPLSFKSLKCF